MGPVDDDRGWYWGIWLKWNDMIVTVICEIWAYYPKLLTQQKAKGLGHPPSQLLWLITARRIETCFSGHVHLQRIEAWTASNWVSERNHPSADRLIHMHIWLSITLMDTSIHPVRSVWSGWQMGCDISLWFMRNALTDDDTRNLASPVTLSVIRNRYWYYISWWFD